jgi:hypothetical protein
MLRNINKKNFFSRCQKIRASGKIGINGKISKKYSKNLLFRWWKNEKNKLSFSSGKF